MPERVYKKILVTGCSEESYERATQLAVRKAAESLHGLSWFEVQELRGSIQDDGGIEFQVTILVAFKVD